MKHEEMTKTATKTTSGDYKFYVVSRQDLYDDTPVELYVLSQCPRGNMSHNPVENGWCGTTNNVYEYCHGGYDTWEEAAHFIETEWPDAHLRDDGRALDLIDKYVGETPVYQIFAYVEHRFVKGPIVTYDRDDCDSALNAIASLPGEWIVFGSDGVELPEVRIPTSLKEEFAYVSDGWELIESDELDVWVFGPNSRRRITITDARSYENEFKSFYRALGYVVQVVKETYGDENLYFFLVKEID
jgi:hypothetical protein